MVRTFCDEEINRILDCIGFGHYMEKERRFNSKYKNRAKNFSTVSVRNIVRDSWVVSSMLFLLNKKKKIYKSI